MAEVKAAEKGRQSEHLEKEVSSRGNCTSSSKTVDKDSCKDNSDSTAAKTYMRFYAGAVTQDSGLEGIRFDFNYGARVEVPGLVITGYDFWTGKPVLHCTILMPAACL